MRTHSLKPFDDGKYLSEEEALKLLESIPIPEEDSEKTAPPKVESDIPLTNNPNLESRIIQLDSLSADNGRRKTQDEWITYWNNITDGQIFASMPDYYQAFKQLKNIFEYGSAQEKNFAQKIIDSLREDFDYHAKLNWLLSSTRIKYRPDKEDAQIIHHYNCINPLLIQQHDLLIPEYEGVLIPRVLDESKGLTYLQILFGTKDDKETIMQILEFISNKPRTEIAVWTPPVRESPAFYKTRQDFPERASILYCNINEFSVDGSFRINGDSLSRGVRLNPAPKSGGAP